MIKYWSFAVINDKRGGKKRRKEDLYSFSMSLGDCGKADQFAGLTSGHTFAPLSCFLLEITVGKIIS